MAPAECRFAEGPRRGNTKIPFWVFGNKPHPPREVDAFGIRLPFYFAPSIFLSLIRGRFPSASARPRQTICRKSARHGFSEIGRCVHQANVRARFVDIEREKSSDSLVRHFSDFQAERRVKRSSPRKWGSNTTGSKGSRPERHSCRNQLSIAECQLAECILVCSRRARPIPSERGPCVAGNCGSKALSREHCM